jgi:hypothetical protein
MLLVAQYAALIRFWPYNTELTLCTTALRASMAAAGAAITTRCAGLC